VWKYKSEITNNIEIQNQLPINLMEPSKLKIGVLVPIWTDSLAGVTPTLSESLSFARRAEAVGLDSVWLTDHFYWETFIDFRSIGIEPPAELEGIKGGQWECWTTAAAIAVQTSTIKIGTLVSNTTFRNPALLARTADNIMELSGGRLIFGLGAGDFVSEHIAYGFDFERHVSRFENSLNIIKPLMEGKQFSYKGEFHQIEKAALLPKSQTGTPPILIGTLKGKPRMSRLVAEFAEMWNCMIAFGDCNISTYEDAWAPIHDACIRSGRDPESVSQTATIAVNFSDGPYEIMPTSVPFSGSLEQIADRFAEYAAKEVEHVSTIPHPWNEDSLDKLSEVLAILRA